MGSHLAKHEAQLRLAHTGGDYVTYDYRDEDTGRVKDSLAVPRALADDFGLPTVVTITVEPGDRLNEPGAPVNILRGGDA